MKAKLSSEITVEDAVSPFITQPGFLGAPWSGLTNNLEKQFSIVGIPYDGACTNRTGSRFGPSAIRQASLMLCDAIHPYLGVSPKSHLVDYGDIVMPQTNRVAAAQAIESALQPFFEGDKSTSHLSVLGGDHSITLSLLRLHKKKLGKPLSVLHFDAHCDTWEDHNGEPSGHGTWVHEAVMEGIIDPEKTVQIGLRSSGEPKTLSYIADRGGLIQTARELRGLDGVALQPMIQQVKEKLGDTPVYLTVDIDCLDPVYAPGTGTPEPAGMTSNQLMSYLETLELNYLGMDCVEVAPPYDHAQLTAQTAAQVVWTYMCRMM